MQFLKDKFGTVSNLLIGYYYGQKKQPSIQFTVEQINSLNPQDKILALRKLLKAQSIYPQDVQGKIQMQFYKLIKNEKYKNFSFTTCVPPQHPVPKVALNKKLVCFCGQYFIQSGKIVCPVLIEILFEQNFIQKRPIIYVRNPILPIKGLNGQKLLRTTKPQKRIVQIVHNYNQVNVGTYNFKARTDGIQIILPPTEKGQKLDIKLLVDDCIQLMTREFPFVKMKQQVILVNQQQNRDALTQQLYNSSKRIKEQLLLPCFYQKKSAQKMNIRQQTQTVTQQQGSQLPPIIKTIQDEDILCRSMDSQIEFVSKETDLVKKQIAKVQAANQSFQKQHLISSIYPDLTQSLPLNKQLFNLIVQNETVKDCITQVERTIQFQNQQSKIISQIIFVKAMNILEKLAQRHFYLDYKINILKENIISQQHNLQ